ncbi:MAG TPA: HlyD family efflux transporter periplasmic adaptor subunit [Novosphingobium sp.]|nr:HlyD family efflux transporter periplasmic adaptor subunit [Novosphingobium sp.]
MNRRTIVIGVAALALVVAAFVTRGFGLLGPAAEGLTLYGNVDVREVDLAFRVPGRIEAIGPEEGDKVPAGAVLAQLDARPFRDAAAAASGQLSAAAAELAKARGGSRPQEIGQARARLAAAEADVDVARREYERRSGLVASGAISRRDFEATEAQYKAAGARVAEARAALSLSQAGARAEDREAAAAQLASATARRDSAQTDLADTALKAPMAGTVSTRAREPGAIVQPGETVLTLTIDRPMRLRAYVGAEDLSRISPGMAVKVSADGNPRTYEGRISQIAPNAEFTPKTVQTEDLRADLVYRVRVLVDKPDDALRQGQPVTIVVPGARSRSDSARD